MSKARARTIKVDALARVEGEGGVQIRIRDDRVRDLQFRIFEPPRFFEALLRGRAYTEAPDITARICGICPVAYMLSASQAMEQALGVSVTGPLRDLRRLIYCGEWIQSHVLHAAMLHAPDFLGLPDAIEMARKDRATVDGALRVKKAGNRIMEVVGGRAVHPVNLRVGGFHRAPATDAIRGLVDPLREALDTAVTLTRTFGRFDFPDYETDYTFVSMRHPDEYAINEGGLVSNRGLDVPVSAFAEHFREEHVPHSNALHGVMVDGGTYLVGPLARFANNGDQLSDLARSVAAEVGLVAPCRNPYRSLLVRMVETVYALEEAIRIAGDYEAPDESAVPVVVAAGEGHGCTEAPRGICYHRYRVDDAGRIVGATIVPPTSQNQRRIEADLRDVVEANLDLDDAALTWRVEQTIRNYDPCISCATHAVSIRIDRQNSEPAGWEIAAGKSSTH